MFGQMDQEFRIAMMQAAEEQKELGHDVLGADHLLLGLLANVRGSAYRVFADQGVTYDWARRVVAEKHEDPDGTSAEAESSSDLDEDREALRAIGIDLDKVRDAVRENFGEDIGADWGQRRSRSGRGGRGNRRDGGPGRDHGRDGDDWRGFGPFGEGFAGPWDRGSRGRRGPRRRGMHAMSPSLREVMRRVHGEFRRVMQAQGREADAHTGLTPVVLLALLDSDDPAVRAVIEAADDPKALRAAVEELAGHTAA